MIKSLLDFKKWVAPTMHALAGRYLEKENAPTGRVHNQWKNFTGELSPLDIYKYLKARFGEPNGVSMIMKNPTVDNLIHWHYTIDGDELEINFWGHSSGLEISVWGNGSINSAEDRTAFVAAIKADFGKYGAEMGNVHKQLEKWKLFLNPFVRLHQSIHLMLEELESIDITEPTFSKEVDPDNESYFDDLRNWTKNVTKAAALGTTIRMLFPVMAEAFVNLVIFIFRRSELKDDGRLYDGLIRQAIDVRVKSLNMICDGFNGPISGDDERFKDFHNLMNGRNDFLHGNVNPAKLEVEDLYFDQKNIPLYKSDNGVIKKMFGHHQKGVTLDEVRSDERVINGFMEMVLEKLEQENFEEFIGLMGERFPAINEKTKKIEIKLPNNYVEGIAIPGKDVEVNPDFQRFVSAEGYIQLYYPASWKYHPVEGRHIFSPYAANEGKQISVIIMPIELVDMKDKIAGLERREKKTIQSSEWYILPAKKRYGLIYKGFVKIVNNDWVQVTFSYEVGKKETEFSDVMIESILGSIKFIPKEESESVVSKYKFELFLRGMAASELLLRRARENDAYFETSNLLRCQIDGLLRIAVVLKTQILANSDILEDKWVYSWRGPDSIKVDAVVEEAQRLKLASPAFWDEFDRVWQAGDFIDSSFAITPITMPGIEEYLVFLEEGRNLLFNEAYDLETKLIELGIWKSERIVSRDGFVMENLPAPNAKIVQKSFLKKLRKTLTKIDRDDKIE